MAATDIKLSDYHIREHPHANYKTVQRWARDGLIKGAHKDPGGSWVVDLAINKGADFSPAANDTGLCDDVFHRLQAQ